MEKVWYGQLLGGAAHMRKESEVRCFMMELRERGVKIEKSPNEGNVVVTPVGLMTDDDRAFITENKQIILASLNLEIAVDNTLFTPSGYVYFLRSGPYVKIGKTTNLDERIKTLRIQLPFEVELVHAVECRDHHEVESSFHEMFKDHRVNGEWFEMPNERFNYILQHRRIK